MYTHLSQPTGDVMSGAASSGAERRQFRRAALELPATVVCRSAAVGSPKRIVGLHVLDVSRGGLGAIAPEALGAEEAVTVFFPPMGARKGRDTQGLVVQCFSHENRFRVGIKFREPWPEHDAL